MTPVETTDVDYIYFLIAEFCAFSCCEAERCRKYSSGSSYKDSFRRLKKNCKVNYAYTANLAIKKQFIPDGGLEFI